MTKQIQTVGEERRGLRAKIIGFTAFPDGQDKDCIAITDDGKEIIVDPFVGCSWEYEKRQHLLNEWFEDPEAFLHKNEDQEVWLTGELYKVPYKYKSTESWIKRRLIDIYLFIKDLLKKL